MGAGCRAEQLDAQNMLYYHLIINTSKMKAC